MLSGYLTALAWQAVKLGIRSDSNAEWLPHSSCMAGSEVGY